MRIGIDIGGTFTDFVVFHPESGRIEAFKILSTPHNPAEAVLEGLNRISGNEVNGASQLHIVHGSTVATNALLERKGAKTGLVTTAGFRDVLQIGRQDRPALYDLFADPPPVLVPGDLRLEAIERVNSEGEIQTPLQMRDIQDAVERFRQAGVESVAVCFLFSFLAPQHEQQAGELLRSAGFNVSLSSEILPEYREYERTSTTTVNAYVSPVMDRYLNYLDEQLKRRNGGRLRVMQSNGGHIRVEEARRLGARCILSGPVGGAVGARFVSRNALEGLERVRLITFDMGGTSTDVSLIDGELQVATESMVGGCPIRIPVLDIHTIGAGGGSIAAVDAGGALRVGPESAGADPGPACYGRGPEGEADATVTDANLVLGRLAAEHFLGGKMPLDTDRARKALEAVGEKVHLDAYQAALGMIEVVNAHMERALRVISVERGHDPRDFTLLSFGGAGGLHAADLARQLGIQQVLIPPLASTLSALGMLAADVVKDYAQTVMIPGDTPPAMIAEAFEPMLARGRMEIQDEGVAPQDISLERLLDMRYQGQSYELRVPWPENGDQPLERFHQIHAKTYGYSQDHAAVEIVNLRVRATGKSIPPPLPALPSISSNPDAALMGVQPVCFPTGSTLAYVYQDTPFYRYEMLQPGNQLHGPAVIVRADTTILLGPVDRALVDRYQNIIITIESIPT